MRRLMLLPAVCVLSLILLCSPAAGHGPTPIVTLEEQQLFTSPLPMPPIEPGYQLISRDNGFEREGDIDWLEYGAYPLESLYPQIYCNDVWAEEGSCYLWQCAYDNCLEEVRQYMDLGGWMDIHVDFLYHVETYELPDNPAYTDIQHIIWRSQDGDLWIPPVITEFGNQDATWEWTYRRYRIENIEGWGPVILSIWSETNGERWTGFYLDGLRVWGRPGFRVFLPMVRRGE